MKFIDFRVPEGKELENYKTNVELERELTKDLMLSISCTGFNTRSENGKRELITSIKEIVKRQRKLFKTSSTNGCANVYPSLVTIHNYGFGVYGKETKRKVAI